MYIHPYSFQEASIPSTLPITGQTGKKKKKKKKFDDGKKEHRPNKIRVVYPDVASVQSKIHRLSVGTLHATFISSALLCMSSSMTVSARADAPLAEAQIGRRFLESVRPKARLFVIKEPFLGLDRLLRT